MGLSKRLNAVMNCVRNCECVVDIGSDHGYIPIALVNRSICRHAIACDINVSPLKNAKDNIAIADLDCSIDLILSDGLASVNQKFDCAIIAGMGFETIVNIISSDLPKFNSASQIVIQSNTHVSKLREWMYRNGFCLDQEDLVYESHYYTILSYHYALDKMSDEQFLFGKFLDYHYLNLAFWENEKQKNLKILKQLDGNNTLFKQHNDHLKKINQYIIKVAK